MTDNDRLAVGRTRTTRAHQRTASPIAILMLGGLFALALLAPLPTAPNVARAEVMERVEDRLPGWEIVRTDSSWEGAWTVVAECGDGQVGFQLVPGHGLAPGDAWLQPEDSYSRSRLRSVSDHGSFLIWYQGEEARTLSCRSEMARQGGTPSRDRSFD